MKIWFQKAFLKIKKTVEKHWKQSPVPLFIAWVSPNLPFSALSLVIGFCVLLFVYDFVEWRLGKWRSADVSPRQRSVARTMHNIVFSILLVSPIICVLLFEARIQTPKLVDSILNFATTNSAVLRDVQTFSFTAANSQTTNYTGSLVGKALPTGAILFKMDSVFAYLTADATKTVLIVGTCLLFFCIIILLGIGCFEAIAESVHQSSP